MEKVRKIIFSNKTTVILLFILALASGLATFIENSHNTFTAKVLVYNAYWFELLLFLLALNIIGNIKRHKLFNKGKIASLLIHLAFILMIIGGGVTRYSGFDGDMHIREDSSSNIIYSSAPYLQLTDEKSGETIYSNNPVYYPLIGKKPKEHNYDFKNENSVLVSFENYIINEFPESDNIDSLVVRLTYQDNTKDLKLPYDNSKYIQEGQRCTIGELDLEVSYGPKPMEIPFSIHLNKFNLERYPGSHLPSSYSSDVILNDSKRNIKKPFLISKNNVLNYRGYRFFQILNDEDEKGTILSVNHDFWGTLISYLSYSLLGFGMILLLFSKGSRFRMLDEKIRNIRIKRKELLTILIICSLLSIYPQTTSAQTISKQEHIKELSKITVLTYRGRLAPLSSLATDVIHKISKKDRIKIDGLVTGEPTEVFMDMFHNPGFWEKQEIIYLDKEVGEILGIDSNHASFADFFEGVNQYKLSGYLDNATSKRASEQTRFDKAVIKVTERVNICFMVFNGSILKIVPDQVSKGETWLAWSDSSAVIPLKGDINLLNGFFKLPVFNYRGIMQAYQVSLFEAQSSGNYTRPNQIIGHIKSIQNQLAQGNTIPTDNKIQAEVFYNKTRIFTYLKYFYGLIGICLLILSLILNFRAKTNISLKYIIRFLTGALILAFAFHSFGLGLRWYITGHAPWSNGYEALIFVAWGSIVAGLYFIRHSKITLSTTSILAFLMLMTAGHSYYDPQLTNLQPVLKSPWLIFHVATLTIAYALLALGFLLGLINLILFLNKSRQNEMKVDLVIKELSYINEKAMYAGLFLAITGTFLGGIWANESWGRYWGWDPKETWSLIIIVFYSLVLHLRLIPKLKSLLIINIGSIIAFGTVLMTFIGVNYYFTKGLHSYASDDPPIFPLWAWITIIALISLIVAALVKEKYRSEPHTPPPLSGHDI